MNEAGRPARPGGRVSAGAVAVIAAFIARAHTQATNSLTEVIVAVVLEPSVGSYEGSLSVCHVH